MSVIDEQLIVSVINISYSSFAIVRFCCSLVWLLTDINSMQSYTFIKMNM